MGRMDNLYKVSCGLSIAHAPYDVKNSSGSRIVGSGIEARAYVVSGRDPCRRSHYWRAHCPSHPKFQIFDLEKAQPVVDC